MEESTKKVEIDSKGKFGLELGKIKSYMRPGTIKIEEIGLIRKKRYLICFRSDESIIIVDLESGDEIYRSDGL